MLNTVDRGIVCKSVNDGADPRRIWRNYNFDWNNDFANPVLNSV
jgi:hypothetical protein